MDKLVGSFGPQLQSFKVTRQLLHQKAGDPSELSEEENQLRRGLQWQRKLTGALLECSVAVADAFQAVSGAQQTLYDAGIADAGLDSELIEALCHSLREAKRVTAQVAAAAQRPLKAHQKCVGLWLDTVQKSDVASAELKHYEEKLVRLTSDYEEAVRKGRASGNENYAACHELQALENNKRKLAAQQQAAAEAKKLADQALREADSKRGELCTVARDIFYCSTEALQSASTPLQAQAPAPLLPKPRAMTVESAPQAPPRVGAQAAGRSASCDGKAPAPQEQQGAVARAIVPANTHGFLSSPNLLRTLCHRYFRRCDANGDGVPELREAMTSAEGRQEGLGVPERELQVAAPRRGREALLCPAVSFCA